MRQLIFVVLILLLIPLVSAEVCWWKFITESTCEVEGSCNSCNFCLFDGGSTMCSWRKVDVFKQIEQAKVCCKDDGAGNCIGPEYPANALFQSPTYQKICTSEKTGFHYTRAGCGSCGACVGTSGDPCDDGNPLTCNDLTQCDGSCNGRNYGCGGGGGGSYCGDGTINAGETCDDAILNAPCSSGAACSPTCTSCAASPNLPIISNELLGMRIGFVGLYSNPFTTAYGNDLQNKINFTLSNCDAFGGCNFLVELDCQSDGTYDTTASLFNQADGYYHVFRPCFAAQYSGAGTYTLTARITATNNVGSTVAVARGNVTFPTLCGNGILNPPAEQCEQVPNGNDADGCTDSCRFPIVDAQIVSAIPNPSPRISSTQVEVETNVPGINCIGLTIDGRDCNFQYWDGATGHGVFDCLSGVSCTPTEILSVFVDEYPLKNCVAGDIGPDFPLTIQNVTETTFARCTNGYDDDCDTIVDELDDDCWASFSGYVKNDANKPLSSATVSVLVPLLDRLQATNNLGYFAIAKVPPGIHTVTAIKPGYQSQSVQENFPILANVRRNFTLTNGSCNGCLDWEGRCSAACSGSPQCYNGSITVPLVCDGTRPGEWRSANTTLAIQCCAAINTKPKINSSLKVDGCMRDLVTHERLVRYQGELVTLRVYTWEPCFS